MKAHERAFEDHDAELAGDAGQLVREAPGVHERRGGLVPAPG